MFPKIDRHKGKPAFISIKTPHLGVYQEILRPYSPNEGANGVAS